MPKRNRPPEEQVEGSPAWMNTYGDMVTLMLTFFVLLFSFSTVNAKKWEEIVRSFSGVTIVDNGGGANEIIDNGALDPEMTSSSNNNVAAQFDELYERIKQHIDDKGLEAMLEVTNAEGVITIRMKDSALFDSGKDTIRKDSLKILTDLVDIMQVYNEAIRMIRIEGHTDNVPISNANFKNNWDLSVSRAINVLEYLLTNPIIPPGKLSAAGYGEYHPIDTNDTAEGRARNRRVDFVIMSMEQE